MDKLKFKTAIPAIFRAVSLLGVFFVLIEMVLRMFGASICSGDGCGMVSSTARFGDMSILLLGLSIFAVITILSSLTAARTSPGRENLLDLVLIVSLASEGFFTGYQAFRLQAACVFCLIVFGFLIVLGGLRLLQGRREVLAGFASLAAVFSLFYLVLPANSTTPIPGDEQLLLFYGENCKYCAEVMEKIEEKQLQVKKVQVDHYTGLLKGMGIEHVPTLYVNNENEKIFLTGRDKILGYLESRGSGGREPEKAGGGKASPLLPEGTGQSMPSFELVVPPADDGICKSDSKSAEECD